MVRTLFESITYDLDRRRIVDFRLKPWAADFVILRDELYRQEDEKETVDGSLGMGRGMLHTGLLVRPLPLLYDAVLSLIERLYAGIERPDVPITGKSQPKSERNYEVKRGWQRISFSRDVQDVIRCRERHRQL